jgi:hypothetical protein
MNSAHKWLIAGLSLFLIFYSSFVVWYYFEKSSVPTSQPNLAQNVSDQGGKVLAGGAPNISLYLKDASTQTFIDNALVTLTSPRDSIDYCLPSWTFGFSANDHSYWMLCAANPGQQLPPQITITISKDGYQTKTAAITYDNYLYDGGTIYLDKVTGTASSNNVTNTASSKKTTTATTKNETIKNVSLPSVFTAVGSTTTNLANVTDPKNVTNLTLDVVGKSKVVFSDSVDLSTTTAKELFEQLDSYVRMKPTGVVAIDSSVLSMLANKRASISMFNLPFVDKPDILVNGKLATSKIVSNTTYKNKTLSFNVTGFSQYEAVPKLTIIEPKNGLETSKQEITLTGKITDPTATVSAKLNGQPLGKLKVATASGEFSTTLNLTKGTNNIRVEALSKFGPPLAATASAIFKPLVSSEMFIIGGIGLALILIVVIVWWYYKKRKSKIISTI